MARISKADYETVEVTCDRCGALCILNRREDFTHPGPYWGENINCPHCRCEFWMAGDTINLPYELFVFAAKEHFAKKRYMLSVATMAQSWELFFSMFSDARFLWRPFFSSAKGAKELERLNALQARMKAELRKSTFQPLRNLLTNTVVKGIAPANLDEAEVAVGRIESDGMLKEPSPSVLLSVADPEIRAVLEGIRELSVSRLRNDVLHHRAYRPLRAEAEKCLRDEAALLYRAKRTLAVGSFEEFQAGIL